LFTSVAYAIRPSVTTSSTDLFFLGIYLNFQWHKSRKNQYLPLSESKSYQINSIKSYSSRSFEQHQRHISIPLKFSATIKFSVKKSFNIQEFLHYKSKHHGTKPMHPSSSKTPRTQSKASQFSGSHNCKNKTKQIIFLHRYLMFVWKNSLF